MNQKGFAPILIVLIFTVVAFVSGYFVYTNYSNNQTEPTPSPVPDQVACTQDAKLCPDGSAVGRVGPKCEFAACPSPKESTSSADMANWKIYTDSKFSFQYPTDASVTVNKPTGGDPLFDSENMTAEEGLEITTHNTTSYGSPDAIEKYYDIRITVKDNSKGLGIKELVNKHIDYMNAHCSPPGCNQKVPLLKQYKNGDIDGYISTLVSSDTGGTTSQVIDLHNGKVYIFEVTGDNGFVRPYGLQIFNQILSTFKFLP